MRFELEMFTGVGLWVKAGAFALHWANYSREEIPRRAWRCMRHGAQLGRAVVIWEYRPQLRAQPA